MCGRRNFHSRKADSWDFGFFSFQEGTKVSRLGVFHKQNCQIESVLKENFSCFDGLKCFFLIWSLKLLQIKILFKTKIDVIPGKL